MCDKPLDDAPIDTVMRQHPSSSALQESHLVCASIWLNRECWPYTMRVLYFSSRTTKNSASYRWDLAWRKKDLRCFELACFDTYDDGVRGLYGNCLAYELLTVKAGLGHWVFILHIRASQPQSTTLWRVLAIWPLG